MFFSGGIDEIILKCIWKGKGTITAKTVLKKNKEVGLCLLNFKTYYYINQDCVILVEGETHRSVDLNREPRNRPA